MDWIIEIGLAILRMWMQPFIYLFFLLIIISGYVRVYQDRKSFGTKVYPYFHESKNTWSVAIVTGIVLSVLSIAFGFLVSLPFSLILGLVMVLLAVMNKFSWLSSAYTVAILGALMYFIPIFGEGYIPSNWIDLLDGADLFYLPFLVAILLLAEVWMLFRTDNQDTFPELVKSNRGKFLGQHRIKKITIIPFITLLPFGLIEPFADWWPIIEVGETSFGLIVIPYLYGFEYVTRTMVPKQAAALLAKRNLWLSVLILLIAAGGYFIPLLTVVALAIGFLGKEVIQYSYRRKEQQSTPFFQATNKGLLVLGVLPNTPAIDMGLLPGERIIKVNDQPVESEEAFYKAVNENRAFCKLNIKDLNGEIRFAQRALYEGEHHKLGVLFVKGTESHTILKQES